MSKRLCCAHFVPVKQALYGPNSGTAAPFERKKGAARSGPTPLIFLVPEVRIELTRACARRILSPLRLPISPLRQ